jgi:hypothetical protein
LQAGINFLIDGPIIKPADIAQQFVSVVELTAGQSDFSVRSLRGFS